MCGGGSGPVRFVRRPREKANNKKKKNTILNRTEKETYICTCSDSVRTYVCETMCITDDDDDNDGTICLDRTSSK